MGVKFEIKPGLSKWEIYSLCKFLNANLQYDKFTPNTLKQKIFDDPRFDNSLIFSIKDGNKFIGFIHGVKGLKNSTKVGWIKMITVDKSYRNMGFGKNLLCSVEEKFLISGVKQVRVMDSAPNYYQPGLDPRYTDAVVFFMNNGYKRDGENISLQTNLRDLSFIIPRALVKRINSEGITIKRARKNEHYAKLKKFILKNFPLWEHEVELGLKCSPERVFIATSSDGEIVGFSCYEIFQGNFGPIGVEKQYRKLGIGKILLLKSLMEQRKLGRKIVIIPWVSMDNLGFYLRNCNATVSRVFWTFMKKL